MEERVKGIAGKGLCECLTEFDFMCLHVMTYLGFIMALFIGVRVYNPQSCGRN